MVAVLCGLMTVVGLGLAATDLYRAVWLRDHGVERQARIADVHPGRMATVEVEYTALDGSVVRAETDEFGWDPQPRGGDDARVLVDPEHPRLVVDARLGPSFKASWFGLGIALIGAVSTLLAIASSGRPDEAVDAGR